MRQLTESAYRSKGPHRPWIQEIRRNLLDVTGDPFGPEGIARIEAIAKEKNCTPSQLTLAWLLAQGPDVVAIPGTRYKARLDENVGALQVKLSPEDVARISAAVPSGAAAGTRYPAGGMKTVYV